MIDKSNDAVRRFFGVEDMETIESLGLRYVVTTALPEVAMKVTVDYLPVGGVGLIWPKVFNSEKAFHCWLADFVCSDCTDQLTEEHGFPEDGLFSVRQLLNTPCGCELSVERSRTLDART